MDKNKIIQIFKEKNIKEVLVDEKMKNHTTFQIGGPVDIMIIPKNEDEVVKSVEICRENKLDFFIMGNGSNLLVRDGGIRGVVIKINEGFNKIRVEKDKMICQSGALMKDVSKKAMDHVLTGIEFAEGIPGTIGGAITMNAGAYGGEIKDVVSKVRVLDKDNKIREYSNQDMDFRYRGSKVSDEGLIVLSVEIQLAAGDFQEIREEMEDLNYRRSSKQPLDLPSGGSTFKRPEGYYAGKLIDDSGLRGLKYGGAQVSEKHCGFVVNVNQATCKDVLGLIGVVQKTVRDNYGVDLEREIKLIGEDF